MISSIEKVKYSYEGKTPLDDCVVEDFTQSVVKSIFDVLSEWQCLQYAGDLEICMCEKTGDKEPFFSYSFQHACDYVYCTHVDSLVITFTVLSTRHRRKSESPTMLLGSIKLDIKKSPYPKAEESLDEPYDVALKRLYCKVSDSLEPIIKNNECFFDFASNHRFVYEPINDKSTVCVRMPR